MTTPIYINDLTRKKFPGSMVVIMTFPCDSTYETLCRVPSSIFLVVDVYPNDGVLLLMTLGLSRKHIRTYTECNNGGMSIQVGETFYLADYQSLHG